MLHVLILRYTAPRDRVAPHVPDHVAHLERWHAAKSFLASGQTVPDDVGGVILAVGTREEIEAAAAEDPLVRAGVAESEILTLDAVRVHPDLKAIFAPEPVSELEWDEVSLRGLVADPSNGVALLEKRPLRPVLQQAGQALLGALAVGREEAKSLARRCVDELSKRDWAGDEELAAQLTSALEGTPSLHPQVVVDLGQLADGMEGPSSEASGRLDLRTGEVWPAELMEMGLDGLDDEGDELDEDGEELETERFLYFRPDSSEAYRDMADFAEEVADQRLRGRLNRALDGRGPFRRFKDVLHEAPEPYLAQWYIFSQERSFGRAREWLAEEGYAPVPEMTFEK